jgi:SAM-dependent methyltransferase
MPDTAVSSVPVVSDVGDFTAHNIELPDGRQTRPGTPLVSELALTKAALRTARAFAPVTDTSRPRVVDLGCLEGGYAVEFARAGYEVLGIEARTQSVARCQYVADALRLPNLRFAQDDVRHLSAHGEFDVVFCCGLLYHLDQPATFLQLLGHLTTKLLLLQTHFATLEPNSEFKLSPLCANDGLVGRWYQEGAWSSQAEMEASVWASWGNTASFWPEKKHLLHAMRAAGFPLVYEQFDALEHIVLDPYIEEQSRSLFVGAKV